MAIRWRMPAIPEDAERNTRQQCGKSVAACLIVPNRDYHAIEFTLAPAS
ncbi:MAG: hypothetical protein R3C19_23220 [Planctomycetaceae bacterium]